MRSENKSHNTIWAYIHAVRLFGEWACRQKPVLTPEDITHHHVQDYLAELIERTSPGNRRDVVTEPTRPPQGVRVAGQRRGG